MGRTLAAVVIIAALTLVVLGRLVYLQVINHAHFTTAAQGNRIKILPLPPTRGLIYDRNGVLLAENLPAYSLEVTPEQARDLGTTLAKLAEIIEITDTDMKRFHRLRDPARPFESTPIKLWLNDDEVARFAVARHRFPGVDIQARLHRHYPLGELTAHVLGYVGRINEQELKELHGANYKGASHTGKLGVEKTYEARLHGQVGFQQVEVDVLGRVLRVLESADPVAGDNLYLTLDTRLQKIASDALGDFNGAVVAIGPNTGGVLALVSRPDYEPNAFINGIEADAYRALNESPDAPLFNRALAGRYPPGSTIKPFIGLAALEYKATGVANRQFCPGYYTLPNHKHRYRDWRKEGHGAVNLSSAIAQSCDVYFYHIAYSLGIDKMHSFLSRFGFGARTGLDISGEFAGLMPSRQWKRRALNLPWYPGETLITGIGQGFLTTTPLQLAAATAVLATRGKRITPRVVYAIEKSGGAGPEILPEYAPVSVDIRNERHWDHIIDAMVEVVHGARGTARGIGAGASYRIAGKTGTAQVFTVKQDEEYDEDSVSKRLRDHALFVAFAPVENPRIAVAAVVENAGSGSSVAAPIVRRIIDGYLLDQPSAVNLTSTMQTNP